MKVLICSCIMLYFIIFGLTSCSKSGDKSNIVVLNKGSGSKSKSENDFESMPNRLSQEDIAAKDRITDEFNAGVIEAVYKIKSPTNESPTNQMQVQNLASGLIESVLSKKVEKIGSWAEADIIKDGDEMSSLKENMRRTTLECIGENGLLKEEKFRERVEHIAESFIIPRMK
ncbi:hypothetical protein [Candidatus Endomicrobiellum agilis]|uniref:hypothetical protein n=1 Tax=Candidatus Endomicrobiellum agilis TaxID=3238957 RepID=UPI0035868DB4|nr:hypothetical protein [Endomicrobium sp.]